MFTNLFNTNAIIRPVMHAQPVWARMICDGQKTNIKNIIDIIK